MRLALPWEGLAMWPAPAPARSLGEGAHSPGGSCHLEPVATLLKLYLFL